jgi:REP element-mobilizing transposase RayT
MSISSKQHRRSIRLPGYDYSQPGEYFITICTYQRQRLFGQIVNDQMRLNALGLVVLDVWKKTPILRREIELGSFVIMPNHFHAIVHILDAEEMPNADVMVEDENTLICGCRGTARRAPTDDGNKFEKFGKPVSGSIPTVVRAFKSAVTKQINQIRNAPVAPIWQRNYYEHIIQTDREYLAIEAYIENNPANWLVDKENR